jgi:hypothetical protein
MTSISVLRFVGILATFGTLLLASAPATSSFVINYEIRSDYYQTEPYQGTANVSSTSNGLFITDTFDQYSETIWEITGAEETTDGRVVPQVSYTWGDWDSYNVELHISFEIVTENGNQNPEPVNVDVWGAAQLNYDAVDHRPVASVCCGNSEVLFVSPFDWLSISYTQYTGDGGWSGSDHDSFFGSYELLTNTSYSLQYWTWLYVETLHYPADFHSWDEYNNFIDTHDYSGITYNQVDGFFQLGMVVHSVPEPSALGLFGVGLVGLLLVRRRVCQHATG